MAHKKLPVGSITGQSPGPVAETWVTAPLVSLMEYTPQLSYMNLPPLAIVILSGNGTPIVPGEVTLPQPPPLNGEPAAGVSAPEARSMLKLNMGELLPDVFDLLACNNSRNELLGVITIVQAWVTEVANGDPGTGASCPVVWLIVKAAMPPLVDT